MFLHAPAAKRAAEGTEEPEEPEEPEELFAKVVRTVWGVLFSDDAGIASWSIARAREDCGDHRRRVDSEGVVSDCIGETETVRMLAQ